MYNHVIRMSRLVGGSDPPAISEGHLPPSGQGSEGSDDGSGRFIHFVDDEHSTELDGAKEGGVDVADGAGRELGAVHEGLGSRITASCRRC